MNSNNIILVSAGLLKPKKEDSFINKKSLYPNYGLISLATVLKNKGYSPIVINGDHDHPSDIIDLMKEYRFDNNDYPILLSLPSFFSISWAKLFCDEIYQKFKTKKIIVGGKWVVAGNENWIKSKLTGVKYVVSSNSENIIEKIVTNYIFNNNIQLNYQDIPSHLDYTTVHNYLKYQPSVEISRGCGRGCYFCLEKNSPYHLLASPKQVIANIIQHIKDYKNHNVTPYFQTSFFKPSTEWCCKFYQYYNECNLQTQWRTQTRIDSISIEKIKLLAKSGLKILDLGLESASPTQILRMNKSKSPDVYLNKASSLIKACHEYGVWAKINILLYAGETHETIKETTDWLTLHSEFIKGLSVNPLFIYRYDGYIKFVDSLKRHGANLYCEKSLDEQGYSYLNLSSTIDYTEAKRISLNISQKIVSKEDFFDLKSFSYFDSSYTYKNFENDLKTISKETWPFH